MKMKKQVSILLIAILATSYSAVVNAASPATDKIYTVEEITENAPGLVGKTVQVQGKATHVCANTGRKIFLASTDGKKTFRINAGTQIDKFDKAAIGKIVTITGVVFEQRVTLEDLDKQEAKIVEAEKTDKKPEHCASEAKADGQDVSSTAVQRVQAQRIKLKKQIEAGGKAYLSYYSISNANVYSFAQ